MSRGRSPRCPHPPRSRRPSRSRSRGRTPIACARANILGALMVVAANLTFHQQLGVSVVGALATAFFGALFIYVVVGGITTKAANERADREIRDKLIEALARVAGGLYTATQVY